jgi:FkbM family methyltransferase
MRALELYASIVNGAFVTGAKLLHKHSSKKASVEEITLTPKRTISNVAIIAESIYKFLIKLTRQNPLAFTKVKDNGDYKMCYHPLILHEVLMVSDLWEINVKRMLTISPNDVFVDVGANIGSFTIPFAKKAQKIIAFEPNNYSFELLKKNISLNHLTNVTTYNMAVSKKRGVVRFTYTNEPLYSGITNQDESTNVTVRENAKADDNNIHLVNAIDLDSVLLKEDRVNWIKIDVEGHEVDVLQGAIQTMRTHKPKILIEIWPRNLEKIKAMALNLRYSIKQAYPPLEYLLLPYSND